MTETHCRPHAQHMHAHALSPNVRKSRETCCCGDLQGFVRHQFSSEGKSSMDQSEKLFYLLKHGSSVHVRIHVFADLCNHQTACDAHSVSRQRTHQ